MFREFFFFVRHPLIALKVEGIKLAAQINISETPLSEYYIDPELVIGVSTSKAAAMLGLISNKAQRPGIDYRGQIPKLGVIPDHNDL
ncbi:MAG: hypothetical protein AAB783_01160 [Patescibacteria group bacterium]